MIDPTAPDDEGRVGHAIDAIAGHVFADRALPLRALTFRSHVHENGGADNERLEFLGDAILKAVVASALFARFPNASEGVLSRMLHRLVSRGILADTARGCQLGPLLRIGRGDEITGVRERPKVLEDALEALLGALYLDAGFPACQRVVLGWFGPHIDSMAADADLIARPAAALKDPKGRLQEIIQHRSKQTPRYESREHDGPDHARIYTVDVLVGDQVLGTGQGSSIKVAGVAAARAALDALCGANDADDRPAAPSASDDDPGNAP